MAIVVHVAAKGAPGVTTSALALAAAWPERRSCVVTECDLSGGSISALYGQPRSPGLTTLATVLGRAEGEGGDALIEHCQRLPGGLGVLVAPPAPTAVAGALDVVAPELRALAAGAGVDVLVDAGRLSADAAGRVTNQGVLGAADLVLVVTRCEAADLSAVHAWSAIVAAALEGAGSGAGIGLLLVGSSRYPEGEVAATLGLPVFGSLPADAAAASMVRGQASGKLQSTHLFRAARRVGEDVAGWLDTRAATHTAPGALGAPIAAGR